MSKVEKCIIEESNIKIVSEMIHNADYEKAYQMIVKILCENPNAPEPHNLLGTLYESRGDGILARKHYRAAYALDPTYKPASMNLERICSYVTMHNGKIDFGENQNIEVIK